MKPITSITTISRLGIAAIFALLIVVTGCTLSGVDDQVNSEITEADLEAASQILGESLSDENDGIMSSLNDAVTTVSQNGFVRTSAKSTGTNEVQDDDDNSGRGSETNISYSYDPATGTHTLTFNRNVNHLKFSKSVSDTLKYIFTDINGDFIAAPRRQRDRVETIDFKGKRQGSIESLRRNSMFSRIDTFLIDGVSDATAILSIDGVHHGEGDMEVHKDNGDELSRTYELDINFLNIEIDKQVVQSNHSLEQGVTGTLSWEMLIEKTNNGSSEVKTIRGTVEMNGDGTALLRFRDFQKLFKIRLDDGDVRDQDNEFEGRVKSVNIERGTFQLTSGRTIRITDETQVDPDGDVTTLNQVAAVLEDGNAVKAEGKGHVDGDVFVASKLKFETEEEEHDGDKELNFEGILSNAFPDQGRIVLQDERTILITDDTEIDESGDLHTLAGVKEALELGKLVIADGKGIETDEEGIDLIATRVRFEQKESDNQPQEVEFEDRISEVGVDAGKVRLQNGTVILVNDETEIDDSSDYESLQGVQEALQSDKEVGALGKGVTTDEEGIDIIAKHIRFVN